MTDVKIPSWLTVVASVILAIPFGWGLGVLAAYILAGKDFGQLPAATVPLSIIVSIVFALLPSRTPNTRLKILLAGTVLFILLAWIIA